MSSVPLVFFLITLLLAAAVCIQGQVTVNDTDYNPVQVGKQYFIQPVETGGALLPVPLSLSSFCPLGITQILLQDISGPPASFAIPFSKKPIVDTYSDVTIEFNSSFWTDCSNISKFWKVNESSPDILIGGNRMRTNSWFQIKEAGANTYEFATSNGSVGAIPGPWFDGAPKLVLTNDTAKVLFVKFKKLGDATTSTTRIEKLGLRMLPLY